MAEYENESLSGAQVELTAPDGTVYRFTYAATIPYAQEDYVVLMELARDDKGDEQLLITRLLETPEGDLSFVVVEEEDIITAVFEKYVAQSLADAMGAEDDCECGHDHGHSHGDDCDCGHHMH